MVYASFNDFPFFDKDGLFDQTATPEPLRGYAARDWAEAILDQPGTKRPDDLRMLRKAEWQAPDGRTSYVLERHEYAGDRTSGPAQIYHLTVMPEGADDFTGYYIDSSRPGVRKCVGDWKDAIRPTGRADREMRRHLATAKVDPSGSNAVPRNVNRILSQIEKGELSRRKRTKRILGKIFVHEID